MIVNASAKDIKCALFQHVRGLLFIPFHSLPSFSLINLCLLGLWPTSYGLENKPLGNKQASGRLLHFSLSSRRAQVMCRCCPNQFCFFIQKAGSGHRLYYLIFSLVKSLLTSENICPAIWKTMGWSLRNT